MALPAQANDKFSAQLRSTWIASPADGDIQVTAIPTNVPTIMTVGWKTDYETVFRVESVSGDNSSNYALTGVTRIKGANVNLPEGLAVNCLNHEEYFNQYGDLIAEVQADVADVVTDTSALTSALDATGTKIVATKKTQKLVVSATSTGTITPNSNVTDILDITALAVTGAFQAPSGTATNGDQMMFRIKDNGTARALSFATGAGGYVAGGSEIPSTTVTGKYLTLGFQYVTSNSLNKWMCLAAQQEE